MQYISITPEVCLMLLITQHPLLTASQASHFLTLINLYKPFFLKQAFLKVYTVMPKMAFSTEQLSCCLSFFLSFLHFFSFIFISWRLITLQYCSGFCHTLTWISHGFTCVPHPDPPSLLLSFDLPTPLAVTCLTSPCRHLNLWSSLSAPPRASQVYILWV